MTGRKGNGLDGYPISGLRNSVVHIQHGFDKAAMMLILLFAFLSSAALIWAAMGWYHYTLSEREARVLNDNVLRLEARLEAAGIIVNDVEH